MSGYMNLMSNLLVIDEGFEVWKPFRILYKEECVVPHRQQQVADNFQFYVSAV